MNPHVLHTRLVALVVGVVVAVCAIAAVWHEGELLEVMYEPEDTALNGAVILTAAADA